MRSTKPEIFTPVCVDPFAERIFALARDYESYAGYVDLVLARALYGIPLADRRKATGLQRDDVGGFAAFADELETYAR